MTFRFARTFSGSDTAGDTDASGRPLGWGTIDEPAERDRLLGYLRAGPVALTSAGYGTDLLDPTQRLAVHAEYRTDGDWIWPMSVAYYLERHGAAPEPDFQAAIAARGYAVPPVAPDVVAAARSAVLEFEAAARAAMREREEAGRPPSRFAPDVDKVLREGGWFPGRDVSAEVDPWLAQLVVDEDLLADRPEAMEAARAVLHEFGNVTCDIYGPGQERALTPFGFYPRVDPPDPWAFETLGEIVGTPLFPIGFAWEYRQHIVIAGDGRVFMDNSPNECLVGANIDEALVSMVRGLAVTYL
jgi:hypothetical protein